MRVAAGGRGVRAGRRRNEKPPARAGGFATMPNGATRVRS
jgi:hypothetical protein